MQYSLLSCAGCFSLFVTVMSPQRVVSCALIPNFNVAANFFGFIIRGDGQGV